VETIYIQHPISDWITAKMESCVLALGFFDGVHIGHQGILNEAKEIAKRKQLSFGVMTFYPHPRDIVNPNQSPMKYLTPLPIKEERFEQMGVDKLFIVKFEPKFAALAPAEFVNQYIRGLYCQHVVAGFDYHYGFKGKGSMETLAGEGKGSFDVTTVSKIQHEFDKISSTAIRELLLSGNVNKIPHYLGDFYEVRGRVERSSFFYKNDFFIKITLDEGYMTPAAGVYKTLVELKDKQLVGVCQQIACKENHSSLLIKIEKCDLGNIDETRVKVIWFEKLYVKKEVHEIRPYLVSKELVI
jgi:riboflavin kinase / FMN adenylyltransferase